jgi:hypothetical protein
MRKRKSREFLRTIILVISLVGIGLQQNHSRSHSAGEENQINSIDRKFLGLPAGPILCEPSLPVEIKWFVRENPVVGRPASFQVVVESHYDPDLVREIQVAYDLPSNWPRPAALPEKPTRIDKTGRHHLDLVLIVPDEDRYQLRARVILTLRNGERLSTTAVHSVDLGTEDPPARMLGRIENRDGTGIRVYRGVSLGDGND